MYYTLIIFYTRHVTRLVCRQIGHADRFTMIKFRRPTAICHGHRNVNCVQLNNIILLLNMAGMYACRLFRNVQYNNIQMGTN